MGKATVCCFTGHRKISKNKISELSINLENQISLVINNGVDTFLSGGALGFDQMGATLVIKKERMFSD